MADLTEQTYDESGTDLTMSAASAGGDQFTNYEKQELVIHNADTSSKDITVVAQNTSFEDDEFGNSVKQDQTLTVSAGGTGKMGTFSRKAFNDSNGKAQITYSDVTSLEIAVVKREE